YSLIYILYPPVTVDLFAVAVFFFSSRRRHTISKRDWSSDVCSSDLPLPYRRCRPADAAGPDLSAFCAQLARGHLRARAHRPGPVPSSTFGLRRLPEVRLLRQGRLRHGLGRVGSGADLFGTAACPVPRPTRHHRADGPRGTSGGHSVPGRATDRGERGPARAGTQGGPWTRQRLRFR